MTCQTTSNELEGLGKMNRQRAGAITPTPHPHCPSIPRDDGTRGGGGGIGRHLRVGGEIRCQSQHFLTIKADLSGRTKQRAIAKLECRAWKRTRHGPDLMHSFNAPGKGAHWVAQ